MEQRKHLERSGCLALHSVDLSRKVLSTLSNRRWQKLFKNKPSPRILFVTTENLQIHTYSRESYKGVRK